MGTRPSFLLRLILVILALGGIAPDLSARNPLPRQSGGEYDVFLLIGQSNMAGRGAMMPGDTSVLEGVWVLDGQGVPVPARNPLNGHSSVRKEMRMQGISPGTAFGTTLAAKTGRKILLVVNALGGSDIESWMKDSPVIKDKYSIGYDTLRLYSEAVRRTRLAMKYGKLRGILWHQGESNAGRPREYPIYLKRLATDLRKDLNAKTVPFIASELGYWIPSHERFNEMIRTIGTFIPDSDYVSARDAGYLVNTEDPHFSREGQFLLGRRYAEKILKMVYGENLRVR